MATFAAAASVTVIYHHYTESFALDEQGGLSSEVVDEEYCISFVMPDAHLRLSTIGPKDYTARSQSSKGGFELPYEEELRSGGTADVATQAVYPSVVAALGMAMAGGSSSSSAASPPVTLWPSLRLVVGGRRARIAYCS